MKSSFALLLVALTLSSTTSCATTSTNYPGEWEVLGTRTVNYGHDRDEILVTRRDGTFRKIKLEMERGVLNMHNCIVVFGDGTRQKIGLKKTFRQGEFSRTIDLRGGRRVVHKVILLYDTKNHTDRRAKVKLLGMH